MMQQGAPSVQASPATATVTPKFSAFDERHDLVFNSGVCPMPPTQPPHFEDMSALEPEFDPDVHLCIEPASKVTLLDFSEVKVTPQVKGNEQSSLAYTGTISPVLSYQSCASSWRRPRHAVVTIARYHLIT